MSQQFDFVYLTGDIPAHNVWEITRDEAVSVASYNTHIVSYGCPSPIVDQQFEAGGGSVSNLSSSEEGLPNIWQP